MTGYFGALMRSSGVGPGASLRRRSALQPAVLVLDQQLPPPAPAVPTQAMAALPLAMAVDHAPAAMPAPGTPTRPAAVAPQAARQAEARNSPAAPTSAAADSPAAPPQPALPGPAPARLPAAMAAARPAAPDRADPAPDVQRTQLLQAALQWVAAGDTTTAHGDGHLPTPAPRSTPSVARMAGPIAAESPGAHAQPLPIQPPQAQPRPSASPAAAVPATPATATPGHSRASPQAGPLPPRPRSELVEVSIGAIHLRIDAPAPAAPLRPAAPAPAAVARVGPPPTTLAPRSSLSRRALRRV